MFFVSLYSPENGMVLEHETYKNGSLNNTYQLDFKKFTNTWYHRQTLQILVLKYIYKTAIKLSDFQWTIQAQFVSKHTQTKMIGLNQQKTLWLE